MKCIRELQKSLSEAGNGRRDTAHLLEISDMFAWVTGGLASPMFRLVPKKKIQRANAGITEGGQMRSIGPEHQSNNNAREIAVGLWQRPL